MQAKALDENTSIERMKKNNLDQYIYYEDAKNLKQNHPLRRCTRKA